MLQKILLILIVLTSQVAWAVEPVEWKSQPIKITLQVGEQRLIHFPDHVLFGRPLALKDKLDAMSLQGTLYLTAKEMFEPTLVKVRLNESGNIVLLNIVAISNSGQPLDEVIVSVPGSEASNGTNALVMDEQSGQAVPAGGSANHSNGQEPSGKPVQTPQAEDPYKDTPFDQSLDAEISPEEMIQFAAREFYAPPRLHINDPRLSRTSVNKDEDTEDLFIDTSYGLYDATPIAAWQSSSGQYLTAVKLVNRKDEPVTINPFHLNMQFSYAAPQHIRLDPRNSPGDTTMLYIITDRPFTESRYETPAPWRAVDDEESDSKGEIRR